MKLNKTKLKNQNLYLIGGEIKNEAEFMLAIKHCIEKVKRGQANRKENSLNESWGIEDLEKLVNCIDFKELDKWEVIKNVDTYYGNYDSTNGYLVITKIDEALQWKT